MRRQEQRIEDSHLLHKEDISLMKLNQTLLPQSYFILFLIIVLSLLANTTRGYQYNVVVGCGIYFLSTKNPFLHRQFYFYLLVGLTICADSISIALLFGKVSVFHSLVVPILQILLKTAFLVLEGLQWLKESKEKQHKYMAQSQREASLIKEKEERKIFERNKIRYMQGKRDNKINPSNYYLPKYPYDSSFQQNFKSQPYKEFDRQEFIDEHSHKN